MATGKSYKLFEVSGIELEYMIVDCYTLKILPVADKLLFRKTANKGSDVENGKIGWSNELVNHVIELKTSDPVPKLNGTANDFHKNIKEINSVLKEFNAILVPTASHPFMNPATETELWQHDNKEIYSLYDRIFDCRSHGWANLQSSHLNLPFMGDNEFGRLHAAVRLLLPLIPAIAASSPYREGKLTGWTDSRMQAYLTHQEKMPSLMGKLIPEAVFTEREYYQTIFEPILSDIEPWDSDHIMDHHFLNSRGAIARFDRGAIEIRVTDLQECPAADIAIAAFITETLKILVNEQYTRFEEQKLPTESQLYQIFRKVIKKGDMTVVDDEAYLRLIGIKQRKITAREIWIKIFADILNVMEQADAEIIKYILTEGSLSQRIVNHLGKQPHHAKIIDVYKKLAECLDKNMMFIG